jgi:hypothetical protein
VEVVELDLSRPFSAARARNEGFERLERIAPNVHFVQFVDGDCELVDGWLERARCVLQEQSDVAVVCGRGGSGILGTQSTTIWLTLTGTRQ